MYNIYNSYNRAARGRSFGEDYKFTATDMRFVWFDIKPTIRNNFKKPSKKNSKIQDTITKQITITKFKITKHVLNIGY